MCLCVRVCYRDVTIQLVHSLIVAWFLSNGFRSVSISILCARKEKETLFIDSKIIIYLAH